ncbi:MAG: TraU family protein [Candidatus Thiodiazotropha sp.]
MFWCAGCQGSLYPLGGNTSEQTGGVMASNLLAERLVAKMHRQLMAWDTTGWECGNTPMPIIKKSQLSERLPWHGCGYEDQELLVGGGRGKLLS